MKINIYDSKENCIDFIDMEDVENIVCCKDGRHLITTKKKCESCGHIELYTRQIPAGYLVDVR